MLYIMYRGKQIESKICFILCTEVNISNIRYALYYVQRLTDRILDMLYIYVQMSAATILVANMSLVPNYPTAVIYARK